MKSSTLKAIRVGKESRNLFLKYHKEKKNIWQLKKEKNKQKKKKQNKRF